LSRKHLIEELLERFECELEELTNTQLEQLINEYEHSNILSNIIEDDEIIDDEEENELPLIDGDEWETE